MNTTYLADTLLIFCCLLLIGGCSHTPIVDYAVRNRAGRELNHVKITIGKKFEDEMGVLIPDAHSGYGGPVPVSQINAVKIEWENPGGRKASASLEVSKRQLLDKRQLFFDIRSDDSVTLAWRFE